MPSIEADCLRLITEAMIPGIAGVIIRNGQLDSHVRCGMRSAHGTDRIDEYTVFDAASLSKPVFAHAVLQLVDQGDLSLDAPLGNYLSRYVPVDDRASSITARQVLSHSTGLPNWRNADTPLKTYFRPGDRFSYSGEGFLYLQRAIEAIAGEKLHSLADRLVFQPLGMTRSGFVWDWRYDENRAYPHDAFGRPALGGKPGEGNAAWSLQTTAADFARFLLCVLDGWRLQPETARAWLHPHIDIRHPGIQCLGQSDGDLATGVAWGLGWGLEPSEGTFFHWGDNGPFTAFTMGSMNNRDAAVFFMNGASGLSIMPELLSLLGRRERPSLAWLDYVRHDAPVRRLLRSACARGVIVVWPEMESAGLDRDDLIWIAQGLLAAGRESDDLWLRARIAERAS
jgi:CubicO group peptidase (beta-lactamase class C family)